MHLPTGVHSNTYFHYQLRRSAARVRAKSSRPREYRVDIRDIWMELGHLGEIRPGWRKPPAPPVHSPVPSVTSQYATFKEVAADSGLVRQHGSSMLASQESSARDGSRLNRRYDDVFGVPGVALWRESGTKAAGRGSSREVQGSSAARCWQSVA